MLEKKETRLRASLHQHSHTLHYLVPSFSLPLSLPAPLPARPAPPLTFPTTQLCFNYLVVIASNIHTAICVLILLILQYMCPHTSHSAPVLQLSRRHRVQYIQAQGLGARLVYTLLFRPSILPFGTSGTFGLPGMRR